MKQFLYFIVLQQDADHIEADAGKLWMADQVSLRSRF